MLFLLWVLTFPSIFPSLGCAIGYLSLLIIPQISFLSVSFFLGVPLIGGLCLLMIPQMSFLLWMVSLPLMLCLCLLILPHWNHHWIRIIAFNTSLLNFLISLLLWIEVNKSAGKLQFMVKFPYTDVTAAQYGTLNLLLKWDEIFLIFLILTTYLISVCLLLGWGRFEERKKEFWSPITLSLAQALMVVAFPSLSANLNQWLARVDLPACFACLSLDSLFVSGLISWIAFLLAVRGIISFILFAFYLRNRLKEKVGVINYHGGCVVVFAPLTLVSLIHKYKGYFAQLANEEIPLLTSHQEIMGALYVMVVVVICLYIYCRLKNLDCKAWLSILSKAYFPLMILRSFIFGCALLNGSVMTVVLLIFMELGLPLVFIPNGIGQGMVMASYDEPDLGMYSPQPPTGNMPSPPLPQVPSADSIVYNTQGRYLSTIHDSCWNCVDQYREVSDWIQAYQKDFFLVTMINYDTGRAAPLMSEQWSLWSRVSKGFQLCADRLHVERHALVGEGYLKVLINQNRELFDMVEAQHVRPASTREAITREDILAFTIYVAEKQRLDIDKIEELKINFPFSRTQDLLLDEQHSILKWKTSVIWDYLRGAKVHDNPGDLEWEWDALTRRYNFLDGERTKLHDQFVSRCREKIEWAEREIWSVKNQMRMSGDPHLHAAVRQIMHRYPR